MKKSFVLLASALLLAACNTAPRTGLQPAANPNLAAQSVMPLSPLDETDLAPPPRVDLRPQIAQQALRREGELLVFRAVPVARTTSRPAARNLSVSGSFVYKGLGGELLPGNHATVRVLQNGREVAKVLTDAQGAWSAPVPAPGAYTVRFSFENPRWVISNYAWEAAASAGQDMGAFTLDGTQKSAEAAWIHEQYVRSLTLFAREQIDIGWWRNQIKTRWPGNGNYYTSYTVTLTGAEQWDVNGHEIGHAIYHQALNARSTGGQHKIDECYEGTLALSEGFATFFSGAINLQADDPDARFGAYLVPRRAPIRMENTPDDVCPGNRNEWRVASVLWDVYDRHSDKQDNMTLPLKDIWAAFSQPEKPAMRSALDAYALLRERLNPEAQAQLRQVFVQNTMEVQ